MAKHTIKPLVLCKYLGETSAMTYLTNPGKQIFRPFVMWYIHADGKNILIDTSMEGLILKATIRFTAVCLSKIFKRLKTPWQQLNAAPATSI